MRHTLSLLVAALALGATLWAGARGAGPLPPLGGLLDPARGAWATARSAELPSDATAAIPNLSGPVDVRYDRRGVPHIFATSESDAIRALGFVVARDRLFQLEIQTRAASGRLTEWAGPAVIDGDLEMRRLGLPQSAEARFNALGADSPERHLLEAYAEGVNAWIDQLDRADVPVEYRLIGTRPERWQAVNSLHLFNRMGWILAYSDGERTRAAAAALVGARAAGALFPVNSPIQEPIQPNGASMPRYDFRPLPPPGTADSVAALVAAALPRLGRDPSDAGRSFASNNWAVSPRRTAAGRALLAGDPHLELTLPSIWYEVHLVVPGVLDVYGVTIPGAPGIVIGFNRDVAWSFTNTGADVQDYFRETVDDAEAPRRYQVDGEWRDVRRSMETYLGKRGETLRVDTLLFTHRGPLLPMGQDWVSMRWTVLEGVLDTRVFAAAARATTARQFLDTLAAAWPAPAQNMIAADRRGSIAIRSTGHYPIRADSGSGLTIRDGSNSANDWRGFWPLERYPQAFDPPQGYLASANQQPVDPHAVPEYLGFDAGFEPWRALQINRLLRADTAVTPDAMRRYQTDPGSMRADLFVPFFLRAAAAAAARRASSARLDTAARYLAQWDRRYTKDNERAALFEAAMRQLGRRTWDELLHPDGEGFAALPSSAVTLQLLHDSASVWWDDRRTKERVEDRDAVLATTLEAAYDSLVAQRGPPERGRWRWDRVNSARVMHLLGLPGFSAREVPVQGGPGTLNPVGGYRGFGPSWRMVVELGDSVRAWGTYPGGQSGNPASSRYRDRIPLWSDGILDTLLVPRDTTALGPGWERARLRLVPERRRP